MQTFETLQQPLLGELAMSRKKKKKKEEEKKMPTKVATYVCDSSHGQRTNSARTNFGPPCPTQVHQQGGPHQQVQWREMCLALPRSLFKMARQQVAQDQEPRQEA